LNANNNSEGRKVNRSLRAFLLALLVLLAALSLSTSAFRVSASPTIASLPGPANINICDSAGKIKEPAAAVFGPTNLVYACGDNYLAGEHVILRVIPNTFVYMAANSVRNVSATADSSGHLGPVNLGVFSLGQYDVWVDRSYAKYPDGWWHYGDPVAGFGTCYKGFFVVPEYLFGTIAGLAGCFGAFGIFILSKRRRKVV
jgi:hypothetical protein